ncbi:alpha-xenorhabdolysin family binary toxin subunit B [Xenorhabdus sp. 42]|uniref:alpha-xenorhabdolysin family binary toxin subunit B n=1 Tax=Xenorhabdus szentirmaii TaxID=290112 RepID=UPI0019987C10|nr:MULTISPECIES: alpha-xenorhabdolysin family binary toxin subunit B [unclassified Xenorhabdus]MBD2779567.1 alpha-xenorhabdolysin family binary toxin subunit B [Xenorhabdus sp. 38]MBD2792270.1 alpha-xenorhabdolysin family binary toxin subunit B [Xenorhabdus sp. CUL]MBD2821013.1 alpha-xenorhabdolysin family binary toxin subunit B [Xenorhabdus sp. 42]MBD2826298.1 alpha-xenorhabdolysin family binary toxin subunit B [Xenorhabdus sp. 5]
MSSNVVSQKQIKYPEIKIKELNDAVNNIWRLAARQTSGIEIIGNKIERLKLYSRELNELTRNSLTQLTPILSQFMEGNIFTTIHQINEALEDPTLSDDDRNILLQERDQLIESLSKDIDRVIVSFSLHNSQLAGKISDILNIVIEERLQDILAQTKEKKAELQNDIEQKVEKRNKLDAQREKIIESQDVIRANNIADMFKDFIPSASDIDNLDLTQPKKEAIKQAIKQGVEIARKILGKISEGLKYIDLADARMKLSDQIDQVMKETGTLKATLGEIELRLSGLEDVMQIDAERTTMISEAVKLDKAWGAFANQLHELSGKEINQNELTDLINGQLNFLNNLSSQYNALK